MPKAKNPEQIAVVDDFMERERVLEGYYKPHNAIALTLRLNEYFYEKLCEGAQMEKRSKMDFIRLAIIERAEKIL